MKNLAIQFQLRGKMYKSASQTKEQCGCGGCSFYDPSLNGLGGCFLSRSGENHGLTDACASFGIVYKRVTSDGDSK